MTRSRYAEPPIPASVAHLCEARWEVRFETASDDWLVLPDGCVDIVLLDGRDQALVAGPATRPRVSSFPAGSQVVGIRLLPAAAPVLLGVAASELRDQLLELDVFKGGPWKEGVLRAHDRLLAGQTATSGALLLDALGRSSRAVRPDPLCRRAAELLRHDPNLTVSSIVSLLSTSERHLSRRFTASVGYGPKRLARVMRLHAPPEHRRLLGSATPRHGSVLAGAGRRVCAVP
jgi:hypothetical protein